MKTEVLLDTNILIYALDKTNPYHIQAVALLNNEDYTFTVTTKNIAEYFAVCSKLHISLAQTLLYL